MKVIYVYLPPRFKMFNVKIKIKDRLISSFCYDPSKK